MFRRRSFFFILFALLLIFGLFGMRQRSNFAQGYAEGFTAGQQASSPESAEAAGDTSGSAAGSPRTAPRYPHGHGWGWGFFPIFGFFGFFGLLLKFWLMFMLFGFFMKMLGFGRQRRWHHHWHHRRWPGGDEQPYEKGPEDVEPDIRHA